VTGIECDGLQFGCAYGKLIRFVEHGGLFELLSSEGFNYLFWKSALERFIMPRSIAFVIFTLCMTWAGFSQLDQAAKAEDLAAIATRLQADLAYLSSDALAGRDVGSEGIAKAGEYIAKRFTELGFETDKFDGGPFQEFAIPGPAALGTAEKNQLTFSGVADLPDLKTTFVHCRSVPVVSLTVKLSSLALGSLRQNLTTTTMRAWMSKAKS
jgi:hypothetical protein